MSFTTGDVFVVIRWPADAGLPRYSFATGPHAAELPMVERVQICSSIAAAAALVARLNAEHAAAEAPAGGGGGRELEASGSMV